LKELERLGEEIRRLGEGTGRTDYNVGTYMRNEQESDRVSNRLLMSVKEMRKSPNAWRTGSAEQFLVVVRRALNAQTTQHNMANPLQFIRSISKKYGFNHPAIYYEKAKSERISFWVENFTELHHSHAEARRRHARR
jgi:hypothetical protein